MSDSDSDSSPRPKKTGGRPNFNRLKIKKKTPVSQSADSSLPPAASGSATIVIGDDDDENVIKFFDRAKETYNPLPRKVLHKKRRSESEESDLPPTKKQRPDVIDLDDSGDDDDEGDDDDDEESSAARGEKKLRRAALVRQRFVVHPLATDALIVTHRVGTNRNSSSSRNNRKTSARFQTKTATTMAVENLNG